MEWEGGKSDKDDTERNGSRGCGVAVNVVEVDMKENRPMAKLALVVNNVSALLMVAWMSVAVVEEKKMMMEL